MAAWPEAVSDGLTLPCADCGEIPRFDYRVTEEFWAQHVPEKPARLGVVCLPCLDQRCSGEGLAEALIEVQWTGTGHTVVLGPSLRHVYGRRPYPAQEPEQYAAIAKYLRAEENNPARPAWLRGALGQLAAEVERGNPEDRA